MVIIFLYTFDFLQELCKYMFSSDKFVTKFWSGLTTYILEPKTFDTEF